MSQTDSSTANEPKDASDAVTPDTEPGWDRPTVTDISGGQARVARARAGKPYVVQNRPITVEDISPPKTFWGRYTQRAPYWDFNPYLPSYIEYGKGHEAQAWTVIAGCATFILAQTLLLGHAESQAATLVGMVCITALMAALAIAIILQVQVINGIMVHTRKEAEEVLNRPWNVVSAFLAFFLFVVGVMLFVADLCILAFDTLDDEYHAIWITVLMGGCFLICCAYSCALVVVNYPPIYRKPNPNPLAPPAQNV